MGGEAKRRAVARHATSTEAPKGVRFPSWLISKLVSYGAQTNLGGEALHTFMQMQPDCPAPNENGQIEWGSSMEDGRFWFVHPTQPKSVPQTAPEDIAAA